MTTSVTLLGRLRNPADHDAWREFDARYRELILWFLLRRGLQAADAEDSTQAVITKLVSGLRSFEYDKSRGGFRAYLYRCARGAVSDYFARQKGVARPVSLDGMIGIPSNEDGACFAAFEREWVDHHYRLACRSYRQASDERAVILLEATIAGRSVRDIAQELSMTEPAVHKAQQRLRDRLKVFIAAQLADEEDGHAQRPHS